jgi:DNA replication protein DnaC
MTMGYKCYQCSKEFEDKPDFFASPATLRIMHYCSSGQGYCPDCAKKEARQRTWDSIPSAYEHCSLKHFTISKENENAFRKTEIWCEDPQGFVFLYGPSGVGKTHLAVGAALRLGLMKGKWVQFSSAPQLMADCRMAAAAGPGEENPDMLIDRYIYRYHYLVIDDIGVEKPSEFVQEKMYRLIDGRFASDRPTIITSNFSLDELASRLGERLASRIGSGVVAEVRGDDYRLKHHFEPGPQDEKPEATVKTVN